MNELVCRSGRHVIPLDVARVVQEGGTVCVICLTFDNRLTENDRRLLRSLRIGCGSGSSRDDATHP